MPASEDAFGTFTYACDAIETLIRDHTGGMALGIRGEWGAGKSSLTAQVKARFKQSPTVRFVLFDAWAHEGAPLRRSFLELVVRECADWVDPNEWRKKLDYLSGKRKETVVEARPKLSWLGVLIALELLLVPLGAAVIGAAVDTISWSWTGRLNATAWIGGLLAAAPALTLLMIQAFPATRRAAVGLLIKGEPEVSTTTHSQDPDPSSVEFQETYQEFLKDVLNDHPERRLVIVVDNLDRTTSEDARKLWATLQPFVGSVSTRTPYSSQVWLIVPHASRKSIARALGETTTDEAPRSFLDKSLQLVVDVPTPTLEGWATHLTGLLKEALPGHELEDFESVYRVYAMRFGAEKHRPTPRDLRLFVNQIALLHLQLGDKYSLGVYALYALMQRMETPLPDALLANKVPTLNEIAMLGPSTTADLAAIHFGSGKRDALQLLYGPSITSALANRRPQAIAPFLKQREAHDVIQFALVTAAGQAAADRSSLAVAVLAAFISDSGFLTAEGIGGRSIATVVKSLAQAVSVLDRWEVNDDVAAGLPTALRIISEPRVTEIAFNVFWKSGSDALASSTYAKDFVNFYIVRAFTEMVPLLDAQKLSTLYTEPLTLGGVVTDLHRVVSMITRLSNEQRAAFRFPGSPQDSALLAEAVKEGNFSERHLECLMLAEQLGFAPDHEQIANAANEVMASKSGAVGMPYIHRLIFDHRAKGYGHVITAAAQRGQFLERFAVFMVERRARAAAIAMVLQLMGEPFFGKFGRSQGTLSVLAQITQERSELPVRELEEALSQLISSDPDLRMSAPNWARSNQETFPLLTKVISSMA